jgi:hypothetical protein
LQTLGNIIEKPSFFERFFSFFTQPARLSASLLSGRGVAKHLEDEYLRSVCSVMENATTDEKVLETVARVRQALDASVALAKKDAAMKA